MSADRRRRLGVLLADHGRMLGGGPVMVGRLLDGLDPACWETFLYARAGFPHTRMSRHPERIAVRYFDRSGQFVPAPVGTVGAGTPVRQSLGADEPLRRVWRLAPMAFRRYVGVRMDAARLLQAVRQDGLDILLCLMGPEELARILWRLDCKVLCRYATFVPTFRVLRRYERSLKVCYEGSDAVVTCSQMCRRAWEEYVGDASGRMRVIYNGVELADIGVDDRSHIRSQLGLPEGVPIVGAVGRLAPEKGFDVLIRAMARVAGAFPSARLAIVGDGADRNALESLAREVGVADRTHFLGWRDDSVRLNAAFDVAVVPSVWDEPFGLVVAEAMSACIPVVASGVGGIPEIVENGRTGWLVPPGDPAQLADRIGAVLGDPLRSRQMAQAARKVVEEKFSAEVCRAQYYRLFDEMLSGEKRRVGAVARAFAPRRKSLKPALTRTASGQGDGRKRRLGVLMADHGNMLGGGPLVIGRVIDGMSPDDWDVCIYVRHGFPCSSMVKDPGRLRVRHFDRQPAAEDAAEIPGARDGNSNASRSLGLAALRHAWRDMSLALRRAWRGVPVALRREVGFLRDSARLRALLLEENPDVLVCLMGPAELAAIVDGLPCRTILIYHCPPPTFKTPKRYTDALKRCYERSHAILTCSNECRRRWECFFGNGTGRVQVVYNGTEIPEEERAGRASLRDELGIAADDLAIGAVGRLAPEKGMDVLVRAFQQIVRSEPRARLVLVGDGPERGNLEKLARTAGVSDRVAFLGWRDDAVRLNAAFDVAAVPSVWDEPFGLVVVEAMAAGIPVVASAVGGIPEIIEPGSTGWLVSPGDPDALADALIAALRDPARREAMGREARRQAGERFSMESCRRKYYEVFEKVLREGRLVNPAN